MVKLYDARQNDPDGVLLDTTAVSEKDRAEITELMTAIAALKDAEESLSRASLEYMKLNKTDMRALHYLIVAGHSGQLVTPGLLAQHLQISSASVTKMLDRLEKAGHIVRGLHPEDRRALTVTISNETKEAAMQTVGRVQARRFHAAARLSSAERQVVTRFLTDMANELQGHTDWSGAGKSGADKGE